jgi:GT2 family glycosyltransferase
VTVLHNERSLGRPAAANAGFSASKSRLIVFHDDDDTWSPLFLERAIARWRETGAKGVVTRAEQTIERTEGARLVFVRNQPFFPDLSSLSLIDLSMGNCIVNHAFLFEREVLGTIGGLDEGLPVYDDWDFNLRFLHQHDIEVVPEVLVWYHQREELAAGSARNSFVEDAARVAGARARLINRWLRTPGTQAVGLLIALGPSLSAIQGMRTRIDKIFNLMHGVRQRWPLRKLEELLSKP